MTPYYDDGTCADAVVTDPPYGTGWYPGREWSVRDCSCRPPVDDLAVALFDLDADGTTAAKRLGQEVLAL